jgi:Exostosin family
MIRRALVICFWHFVLINSSLNSTASTESCKYDFTVYVYPLSPNLSPLKLAEEARHNQTYHVCRKCIFEQFALEYVLYDFFTQFCGRTSNPEEADYFYLPIVRDIDYRYALQHGGKRDPSLTENALLQAIEKKNFGPWNQYLNVTDVYWKKNGGADHIIAMPAPVTNLRHQSSMRGFFHYVSVQCTAAEVFMMLR